MNASEWMTKAVKTCRAGDSLERAAQIMWEHDCGVVPVVDADERLVGVVTDRDVCMAAYTRGHSLPQISVSDVMAHKVHCVRDTDPLRSALALMRRARVRRVPVVDGGRRLMGILSMADLARHAHGSLGQASNELGRDDIVRTLAAICEPHAAAIAKIKQRAVVIGLLTDAEVAKVSGAEQADRLVEGDEYVDLTNLDAGVRQMHATSAIEPGHVLARSAVSDASWAKIVHIVAS
jgi:CBS-domain-containing membrane protein